MEAAAGEAFLLRLLQCQPQKLASLGTREPRLLCAGQQQLQQGLNQLAGVLRVPMQQAAAAARKHPRLLFTLPNAIVAQLSALQDLLGLTRSKALRVVLQKPGLLLSSPAAVSRQLRGLQDALGVKRTLVVKLAVRAPVVLQECSAATTASKLLLLKQQLGLQSQEAVIDLFCDTPALLDYSVQSLTDKLQNLKQILAAVPTRASEAAAAAAAEVAAPGDANSHHQQQPGAGDSSSSSSSAVQRNLTSEVRRMVLLEPSLLTRSPGAIKAKVEALSGEGQAVVTHGSGGGLEGGVAIIDRCWRAALAAPNILSGRGVQSILCDIRGRARGVCVCGGGGGFGGGDRLYLD
jgi:ribosomal protein L12E/L44/L45/RPP1/RPP2